MPAPDPIARHLHSAEDARAFFASRVAGLAHERLCVAHLDRDGRLLGESTVDGNAGHAEALLGDIMADALRLGAQAMLVAHNHPNGLPEPSVEDVRTTRMLAGVAGSLGIFLRDHIVLVPDGRAVSFRARGLL